MGSESFTVSVVDTTAPAITVPAPMTIEATSGAGAVATFSASALDIVDGPLAATCVPPSGSTHPLGSTNVTCAATDAASNIGSASFTVTVVDTTAPAIASVTPSSASLWPPNHTLRPISVKVQSDRRCLDGGVRYFERHFGLEVIVVGFFGQSGKVSTWHLPSRLGDDRRSSGWQRVSPPTKIRRSRSRTMTPLPPISGAGLMRRDEYGSGWGRTKGVQIPLGTPPS